MDQVVENRAVDIYLTANVDMTGYTAISIPYRKPDGTEGEWTASMEDASVGEISYSVPNDTLDQTGVWAVKIKYTASDSRIYESPKSYKFKVVQDWP